MGWGHEETSCNWKRSTRNHTKGVCTGARRGELRTTEKLRTGNVGYLWGNHRVTTQRMHRKKLIHVMKMALNKCRFNGHILQEMAQVKNRKRWFILALMRFFVLNNYKLFSYRSGGMKVSSIWSVILKMTWGLFQGVLPNFSERSDEVLTSTWNRSGLKESSPLLIKNFDIPIVLLRGKWAIIYRSKTIGELTRKLKTILQKHLKKTLNEGEDWRIEYLDIRFKSSLS